MPEWRLPFPKEELEVRAMCADPAAIVYSDIGAWIQANNIKPKLTTEEVLDCMWYQVHGDHVTRYEIMRGAFAIPDDLPADLRKQIKAVLKDFTSG